MSYRVELSNRAKKGLKGLSHRDRELCMGVIRDLREHPIPAGAEPMTGQYKGSFKIKVTHHLRVAFTVEHKDRVVVVTRAGQREGVYR